MSSGEAKQTPKVVNYERIPDKIDGETHPIRQMLSDLIRINEIRFNHLIGANLGLCWQLDSKPGPDGIMIYGKSMILSDFQKEFMLVRGGENSKCFDAIVVINKDWWTQEATAEGCRRTNDNMRRGLLNHLLLQIRDRIGVDGEQQVDARGRNLYRKARPDLAIFTEEIRDGAWNYEQEESYSKVLEYKNSLFDNITTGSGVAGTVGTGSDDTSQAIG